MWVGILTAAYDYIQREGGVSLLCEFKPNAVNGKIGFWIYVFYLSKYYEFMDTVILALKKKPIIFLHIWHHAVMIPVTWMWLHDQWLVGSWWCTNVNSLVHAFMYYYYYRSAQGKHVWWKRFITQGQIIQFVTGFILVSIWLVLRKQPSFNCTGGLPGALLSHFANCSFILLFYKFYRTTYTPKKGEKGAKTVEVKASNYKSTKGD